MHNEKTNKKLKENRKRFEKRKQTTEKPENITSINIDNINHQDLVQGKQTNKKLQNINNKKINNIKYRPKETESELTPTEL